MHGVNLTYALHWHSHISVHSVLYTRTCTLKPFEDSEPTRLKVDNAALSEESHAIAICGSTMKVILVK